MDRSAQTVDFSFLAARFFFPLFWDPFLDGWTAVIKNLGLHSALFVSLGLFSLEVAGRVLARTLLGVSCLLALVVLLLVLTSENDFFGEVLESDCAPGGRQHFSGSQSLTGACGDALLDGGSPAVPIDFAGQDHVPGMLAVKVWSSLLRPRWGFRPLTGALRQARKLQHCAIENLSSSFVPHSRLFSLHPSLVSQNSSLLHGSGAMNSCGVHAWCVHA